MPRRRIRRARGPQGCPTRTAAFPCARRERSAGARPALERDAAAGVPHASPHKPSAADLKDASHYKHAHLRAQTSAAPRPGGARAGRSRGPSSAPTAAARALAPSRADCPTTSPQTAPQRRRRGRLRSSSHRTRPPLPRRRGMQRAGGRDAGVRQGSWTAGGVTG